MLQWSSPKKIKGAAIFSKVIEENSEGIYILRYRNRFYTKNVILERYNHLMVYQSDRSVELKNARLLKVYSTPKGLLLLKSQYNRKTQNNDLVANWLDFELKPKGKPKTLLSQPSTVYGDRGNYRIRMNDNKSLISILYHTESESLNYVLHHRLLDANLNPVAEKNIELPYSPNSFYVEDFGINSWGKLTMLTRNTERERRRITKISHSLYTIAGDEIDDFVITDSIEIKNGEMVYNRWQDNFTIVGFFGFRQVNGLEGVLFFNEDTTGGKKRLKYHHFSEDFIKKVNVNSRRKDLLSEGYDFLELIPRSDGGMLCIAEQKEIATENKVTMINGIPQSTSKNVYNFNELLVLNYDNLARMDWNQIIKKNQTTINDGGYFSSAAVFTADKYVQIIFNDQLRNSGEIMQYTIYNNGKMVSNKLLKTELDYVAVIPVEAKQVSSNKLIIPTAKNRRFALLKLIYP